MYTAEDICNICFESYMHECHIISLKIYPVIDNQMTLYKLHGKPINGNTFKAALPKCYMIPMYMCSIAMHMVIDGQY